MSRKFKGTSIPLTAPERLLPTESTGIDLREARSMNRNFGDDRGPRRDFGDDRGPRRDFGDDRGPRRDFGEERGFRREFSDDRPPRREFGGDERFPRRFDRDGDDGPRRTFSRRAEDSGPGAAADSEDDWRAGPSRAPVAPRRFGGDSSEMPERRQSRREEDTAAHLEDDWRAGASSNRPSAFADRRTVRRDDEEAAPRRFASRREDDDSAPVRRFSSRKEETTRADDDDWRRPSREEGPAFKERIERTRSTRPPTKDEEEDDWRAVRAPAPRRTSPVRETPSKMERRRSNEDSVKKAPATEQPKKVAEETWSSDEEEDVQQPEPQEVKPDMEKISKFSTKIGQYIEVSKEEDVTKKIDAITKKIPVNFEKPELRSFEPMKAILSHILDSSKLVSENEISRLVALIAPILLCLEEKFVVFGGSVETFQMNTLEEVQKFVAAIGCPRLSPEEALVELIWLALYDKAVVCEEVFQKWLEADELESPNKSTTLFQTEAFRAWLYEFELPGVEATVRKPTVAAEKDEWSSDEDSDIEALVPKRITAAHVRAGQIAPIRR
jgi:hypothetical protein